MKSRRGLSSVVGAVFAVIDLSTTIGYVTYSMNVLDKYNQSILATNANAVDRSKEQIQISHISIDSNKFNITASNTGSIPIHLTRFWITNTTDVGKVFRYDIDYNLAPGQSQIKIGQSLPIYAKSNQAYDLKLITDRGNIKEFNVNSVGSVPLNIQLLALPPTVASGFKTELVMAVTNNGTSTLTNLVPVLTQNGSPTATCTPDPISSPSIYDTLPPGNTAIFSWAVKITGTTDGQTCKFGAQLQNGYNNNFGNVTITENYVSLTSTSYAQNAGLLTMNYTLFKWTQGNQWNSGWEMPNGNPTAFSIKLTNNNSTQGTNFYISKNSFVLILRPGSANTVPFYIVQNVTVSSTISISSSQQYTSCPSNDWCANVPPNKSTTLYFAASGSGGSAVQKLPNVAETEASFLLLMGKFSATPGGSGSFYAQNLPYLAINIT